MTRAPVKSRAPGKSRPAATRTTRAGIGARRWTEDPRGFGSGRGRASGARCADADVRLRARRLDFVSGRRRRRGRRRRAVTPARRRCRTPRGACARRRRRRNPRSDDGGGGRWRPRRRGGRTARGRGPANSSRRRRGSRGVDGRSWACRNGSRRRRSRDPRKHAHARATGGARPPSSPVCVVGTRGREWSGVGRDEGATADAAFSTGKGRRRTSRRACSPPPSTRGANASMASRPPILARTRAAIWRLGDDAAPSAQVEPATEN